MRTTLLFALPLVLGARGLAAQAPPPAQQIAAAVLAAPEDKRASATVLGFDRSGEVVTLREGSGDLVCLADAPGDDAFSVACYHESLEPYMARGRELRKSGVTDTNEINRIRWSEADAKTLSMPTAPASLYVLSGGRFDPASGTAPEAKLRWNIYTPWATGATTGLAERPGIPGEPWLMFGGTAGAHIMIVP
ncbi:MAG: hypothetical protein R3E98_15700 [Gemmatimonadota bacterium]|nr:hypothetical protein [Gemmatimonadota bacterium]